MRNIGLLTILATSTILTACAGGGGSSSAGNVPNSNLPNISAYNAEITSLTSLSTNDNTNGILSLADSGVSTFSLMSVSSSNSREEKIANALKKIDSMKSILIDDTLEGKSQEELISAISLSGYDVDLIPDDVADLDALKSWIKDNKQELKLKAQRIYDMYGSVKKIAQDNAVINLVNMDNQQDSYISFKLNDKGQIAFLNVDADVDSSEARRTTLASKGKGMFLTNKPNYVYGVRLTSNGESVDLYIEDWNKLEYTKENFSKLQEKLKAVLSEEYEGSNTADFNAQIDNLKFADFVKCTNVKCTQGENIYYAGNDNTPTKITYTGLGKDVGLKYSDFGSVAVDTKEGILKVDEHFVFAGGYNDLKKDKSTLVSGTTFKGKAVATVVHQEYKDNGRKETTATFTGNSQLDFNNGKETLTANNLKDNAGKSWHDIKVESNGDNYNLTFSGKSDNDKFDFGNNTTVENFVHKDNAGEYGAVDIKYYGLPNEQATEAAGYVAYGKSYPADSGKNEYDLNMQLGFGAKKQ